MPWATRCAGSLPAVKYTTSRKRLLSLRDLAPNRLLRDKGYDSNAFIAEIEAAGAQAVIPPRKTRLQQRTYDRHAYCERHLVECFFNRLKQFRRIATRYEKLARNFLSMINLAATYIWLA
jgi:transposase